ncbi:MAG TPA: hypothetical protein PL155_07025 [Candidatus Omnitrophota bacterium]|nr:hypothetical protein [Candidatus Omnitrophota bacterium]HPD85538.1 hypothetical protein [Candidatus Omnitrophota bacterium]HRZ04422.1 hypothetical protein [Candidatus Omnitrophota bacterium]
MKISKISKISEFIFLLTFLSGAVCLGGDAQAQEEPRERMTQEQFAVELVKNMGLQKRLPTAALPGDCVDLLTSFAVEPLKGWRNKEFLTQEDYLVVMAKVHGKEGLVHRRAIAVEEKIIEVINRKWQESYQATQKWVSLNDLLNDKNYFPNGPPRSPYGMAYKDENNDHRVDSHFLPIINLIHIREALSFQ